MPNTKIRYNHILKTLILNCKCEVCILFGIIVVLGIYYDWLNLKLNIWKPGFRAQAGGDRSVSPEANHTEPMLPPRDKSWVKTSRAPTGRHTKTRPSLHIRKSSRWHEILNKKAVLLYKSYAFYEYI